MANDSKYVRLYPERAVAPVRAALEECKRLATERISTADAAVKADVFAADALMGIAKTCLDALADLDRLCFPPDEPLFLLRGQDELAAEAVRHYADVCRASRLADRIERRRHILEFAERMERWQPRKLPD